MTFREGPGTGGQEISQLDGLSSSPKEQQLSKPGGPGLDAIDHSGESAGELDESPEFTGRALEASAPASEDPVRLYLKEIGKVPLLRAEEEVTIGRRIEAGQIALRRALGGIPLATAKLAALVDRVRRDEIPLDDVILLPEGGEPKPDEIKPMLAAVGRIRRLQHEVDEIQTALRSKKRRSAVTRANYHKWVAQNRAAIQGLRERLPLKPALLDELVADIRAHARQMQETRTPKDLHELESQ